MSLKKKFFLGSFWSLLGQFGYIGITLTANIVLARILLPEEFGQFGIILFFIVLAKVLTDSGLGGALIRDNSVSDIDYSTIFIFNLVISVIIFFVIFFSSELIAEFYNNIELKTLLRVSSLILIINAFQIVQKVKLIKHMRFKQIAIYEFFAVLTSAIIGIYLALSGFKVWALVWMQIFNSLIMSILLWIFEGRIRFLGFNLNSFKTHYKFGVNITLASLINSFFDNIYQLILGKYFSISQTGLYYQAKKLQGVPVNVINKLIQNVFFSGLSKIQHDKEKFKTTLEITTRLITLIVGAITITLFVFSNELIILILGEKWIGSSFFLKILSLVGFFYIQEMFNRILFKIFNDTRYILILELFKKSIQALSIAFGLIYKDMEILMYGFLLSSILSYLINFYYTKKKYSFLSNVEIYTVCKVCFIFLIILFIHHFINFNDYATQLIFKLISTIIIFFGGLFALRLIDFKNDYNLILNKKI